MTWLALLFFIEGGLVNGSTIVTDNDFNYNQHIYAEPKNSTYFQIGFELQFINNYFFINGSIENYQVLKSLTALEPHRAIYHIGGGLRLSVFELGIKHFCDHPVIDEPGLDNYIRGGQTKIYLKLENTFSLIGGKE